LEDLIETGGRAPLAGESVVEGGAQPDELSNGAETDRLTELLNRADSARDSRRWTDAAEGYRTILDFEPELAPIWVQYGHMLKETGRHDEARAAYERALRLEPFNADTHLQIGHLLKITNKKISAIDSYARALEIDPRFREAEKELRGLGAAARVEKILEASPRWTAQPAQPSSFYFDISDLVFHHFPSNRSPTGIQRIVLAVAEAALDGDDSQDIGLCVLEGETGKWKLVDKESALHLMMLSHEGAANSDAAWQSALGDVHRALWESPSFRFPKGSTLVSLGAPWGIRRYFAAIRAAKRESGIRCVGYIHDTVPLLYPEYCDGVIPQEFLRWLRRLSRHADLVLANSNSTKRDFQQALALLEASNVPCEVVYPNGDFTSLFERTGEISSEVAALTDNRYALFVGTVQPRKNHLMVVSGWRHLIRDLGPENVPDLVLAGKLGWYWEQLIEFLRKTDNVGGKVRLLNKASDADLQALYKGAMFTIYNSHYEGWGLPVTESLSFGKVPVISRNSALLESGGKHALFYETNSEPSFVETIKDILRDPEILREREKLIHSDPPVRSWGEVFAETRDLIQRQFASPDTNNLPRPEIALGKLYRFGLVRDRANEHARSARAPSTDDRSFSDWELTEDMLPDASQWWDAEDWGVWTRSRTVNMKLDLPEPGLLGHSMSQGDLILFLQLRGHRQETEITAHINGTPLEPFTLGAPSAGLPTETVLSIPISADIIRDNILELTLQQSTLTDLEKFTGGQDRRIIGAGIRSLMLCREQDFAARLSLLEASAGYTTVAAITTPDGAASCRIDLAESDEEGGFLRLGGKRADIAHAPEELAKAAKVL